jgi:hypothetical protein
MLASKTRKLYRLKSKNKESVSVDDLAILVKRLSVQVDDLEHWVTESNQKTQEPELEAPNTSDFLVLAPHHIIDPWSSEVPPNYGALLHRLEDIKVLQNCPNSCCSSTATVNCVQGVPWPEPAPPFSGCFSTKTDDILDVQYTHWCTLMRCLPLMDPVATSYVKTMGLYAMRDILALKIPQKNNYDALSPKLTTIRHSLSSKFEDKQAKDEILTENTTPTDSVEMLNDKSYFKEKNKMKKYKKIIKWISSKRELNRTQR